MARDRKGPVAVGTLQQGDVAVLLGRATQREAIGVVAGQPRHEPVDEGGVADLVLGDRREGHVLLDLRRHARPLRVMVTQDQLVVGPGQQIGGQRVARFRVQNNGLCVRVEGRGRFGGRYWEHGCALMLFACPIATGDGRDARAPRQGAPCARFNSAHCSDASISWRFLAIPL